ncbi:ATP-binding protein [Roseovarius sp. THAF9]|uniref:sensor histidine kinase n=1 Tax=Roseovarius sp. THAF9 TaxID=2587847 RepID=UPI0020C77E33|nr:ATP-binding protein [Roseovarius sp. THAF9]
MFEISREEALREMIIAASGDGILLPLRAATSGLPRRIRFRVGAIRDGGRETSGFVLVSDNADPLGKPFRELNAELESANAKARRERQHRRLLQKSNDDLYAANAELKSFAYAVSHDLKSPVQTVSMLLSELDEFGSDKLDAEKSELVSMSRETLSRMSVLIEDLLRSTHLIGSEIKLAPCALERTVEEVIADLRAEITGAGARVQTGALPVVRGDAVMLRILFQNLLSNAIKFRHPDRRPEIVIGAGPPDAEGRIRITVADNGIGISPEHRSHVFDLFSRLHRHDEIPGSGLGLTMCRRIVQNLNGTIEVDENTDGGSIFTLRLEVADDD